MARLEHVNITVSDPDRTASLLGTLFDWKVRWSGPAKDGGYTVHVGSDDDYLAIYTSKDQLRGPTDAGTLTGGMNHVGIVVQDLDATEEKVIAAGLKPFSHMDYDPGRRFYFLDEDQVEYEVVSYSS